MKQIVTKSCQALLALAIISTPTYAADIERTIDSPASSTEDADVTRNIPDVNAVPLASASAADADDELQSQPTRAVAATMPGLTAERDKLISPPGEEPYYPVRNDGQPFVLNIDQTVNLTRAINQFIWDPRIEGEVWTPFDQPELIERASRLMTTWPEYDEANIYRSFTRVNKFLERISGFGP